MGLLLFVIIYVIIGCICLAVETSKSPMSQGLLAKENKFVFALILPVWLFR